MTTRPFLYIAVDRGDVLEKSWREDLHPRDTYGKFSTIKGGSRVVTKQGKTGVVDKVTDTHYHVTTEDGKKTKVTKDNAIHENDHKKVMTAQAKAAKKKKAVAKKAGKKQSTTKAQNKADGRHKKATPIQDPTAGKKTAKTAKPAAKKAPKKTPRAKEALAAPVLKRAVNQAEEPTREIKQAVDKPYPKPHEFASTDEWRGALKKRAAEATAKAEANRKAGKEQNEAIQDLKANNIDAESKYNLGRDWYTPDVQNLLKTPVDKRDHAEVQRVANKLLEGGKDGNLRLAASVANAQAKKWGIHPKYNIIGNAATPSHRVIKHETGFYADVHQAARTSMYETLVSLLSGAQNMGNQASVISHVVNRMKDKLNNDIYGMMNQITAPHEVRPAIRAMHAGKQELEQKLGREASHEELANHLHETSKHFKEAPIAPAPRWDDKANEWVAGKGKVTDPSERLALLKQYEGITRTSSADAHVGSEGEKEVSIAQNATDEGRSPEEAYERKERQKELEGTLPKAMNAMGMSPASIKVWTVKHSAPSGNKSNMTDQEVADHLNEHEGGWEGKKVSREWVAKHYMLGRKVIADALQNNHPAIAQLKLLKSFVFNMMLKSVYEYDLVKSLMSWGFDTSILRDKFVRTATGDTLFDIKKSLQYNEYIGSYVTVDSGQVTARIVTHDIPKGEELVKAFREFEELQKALFAHKDGGNHAVNSKAAEYVKANKGKYKGMADEQMTRISKKQGALTWSEQLQKEKGGVWISWGGKRILINAESGDILFDSNNEAHREEHAGGVQADKLEYGHEADEAEDKKNALIESAKKDDAAGNYGRSKQKWAEKHGVKWNAKGGEDGKGDFERDEEGNLNFDHSKHNFTEDHGVKAFEDSLGNMSDVMAKHKAATVKNIRHKVIGMHHKLSDEQKKALDEGTDEDRQKLIGQHLGEQEGVRDMLERAHAMAKAGKSGKDIHAELKDELESLGKQHDSMALKNKDKMISVFNGMAGKKNVDAIGRKVSSVDDALEHMGAQELSRAQEESNKKMLPEGHYEIGNKQNGKSMVVKIAHREDPETGKTLSYVAEAFDPKTGKHFTSDGNQSWGQLGKALGMKNNSAESFIYNSNGSAHDAVIQPMDEDEAQELRKNTSLGMQDSMLHKDFKMVDQQRNKDGEVTSTTYAQEMPDGTQNTVEVDKNGKITDPVMARLFDARSPIKSAEDLHNLMKDAVGRKIWVTAHMGSDVHIGDALGHHVQIMYDGKGAPKVVGGAYDGYRYMDSADVPKGSIDPATGEPIKALFKNGKLVDRKMTDNNDVAIEKGNAVMYQDGNSWKKGKVRDVQDGAYQVVDSKGNLIGMFNKGELKAAKEKGRTLSQSGQAVVKTVTSQTHKMNPSEVFGNDKKGQKAQELFKDALRKAKIARAFDGNVADGNLKKNIELEDKHMDRLKKVLGRSKAGKELLKQFQSTSNPTELEIHVPEHLKGAVEAEGVKLNNGKAKISVAKFEALRDVLGGVSLDHKAQAHLADHFKRKDRTYRPTADLKKDYQPSMAEGAHADEYRKQFKKGSFLLDPKQGLYGTQLEGIAHLVERGRGIAGHGMGTGKTILGVMAAMHYKATQKATGQKAKKTLIVAPKGIMSDWGKEIGTHTNSKALYIGSGFKSDKTAENGRKLWGQEGTEQEAVPFKDFKKNSAQHASEDHDFHIVSYDTFMKNRDHFANSGMYDNIAIDEVHAFKNQSGQRGQSLAQTTDKFKNVWGLSGTPMENDAREVHSLIDTITGGKHELGSRQEFVDKYMMKDKKGKIVGVKPDMAKNLGDIMANVVQFRSGDDVEYNDGSKIHFPHLAGAEPTEANQNPPQDFVGDLVDGSRDHKTTDWYGTKHSVTDFQKSKKTVTTAGGDSYDVDTYSPKNTSGAMKSMYDTYHELQNKYLPESKLKELETATATGFDSNAGKKGNSNYLTAMQKLQKYINAPLAHKMFVPGGGNAIESDATNAQAETPTEGNKGDAIPFETDEKGNKRYYESDGQGSYLKNADGSPKLLPPLHHNNPKADYLKQRISTYLDSLAQENADRRKAGKPELMPKVVVKSAYTTFGTDIVDGVLRDLQDDKTGHPEVLRWKDKVGEKFGAGRFTGDADDREDTKVGFRGNKKDYANNQGHLWATTVSPAGKEGVDFGNAHYMVHFDQEWNPQKMAQFTARVRRSDSAKSHAAVGRANAVRVESLHMPGTIEDFMFDAQDKKMASIKQVEGATRDAEVSDKLGDTQGKLGRGHAGFTRGRRNKKVGAKPVKPMRSTPKVPTKTGGSQAVETGKAVAAAEKSLKFVVIL